MPRQSQGFLRSFRLLTRELRTDAQKTLRVGNLKLELAETLENTVRAFRFPKKIGKKRGQKRLGRPLGSRNKKKKIVKE